MDGDRLSDLRDALLCQRVVPVPGSNGVMSFRVTPAMQLGADDLEDRLPDWRENDDARNVYILAFEAGWLAAHRRLSIVLSFPEARGREATAALLALEPALAFDEIVARLRAAATTPAGSKIGNVVPFRCRSPKIGISGEQDA